MSYLVLARKYRPQKFDDLAGQTHIADILKKALKADKIAQAYLLCGPRGIGKTSCARILAKSLNCEQGPTIEPCGKCTACQEIAKGTSFDVLEIDGASNRGIDEIRTLRENVKFAPSYGRFKIYIVDEVHMLTSEAFNALLKTLEEPPEHVKFIFATTEPNKLPPTIISRCQRFDFKRLSLNTIVETMTAISEKEQFKIEPDALYAIAKAAQGSMRDGLSILDQLSALSEDGIGVQDVCSMLGLVETQLLFQMVDAIGERDCSKALKTLEEIVDKGKDIKQFTRDITEHFRHLMIIKIGGKSLGKLIDYPVAIKEMILTQSELFSLKDILQAIDAFIQAKESSRITESFRMPLEIAFAKLIYQKEGNAAGKVPVKNSPLNMLANKKGQVGIFPKTEAKVVEEPAREESHPQDHVRAEEGNAGEADANTPEDTGEIDLDKIKRMWDSLTHAVSREKMSVATYLQEGTPVDFKGEELTIGFSGQCVFQKETLEDHDKKQLVQSIFSAKLNINIIIKYAIDDDCTPQEEAPAVQDALGTFQGTVVSRWHNE